MKTVFFGSPAAALPSLEALLAAGHTVELVVTQPDKPAGRGRRLVPSAVKAFAAERRLPVIEPAKIRTDEAARERIVAAGPDVNVVVAYGQIIPTPSTFSPPSFPERPFLAAAETAARPPSNGPSSTGRPSPA
jgi:methionyl-tRNA formyltransferase